MKALEDEYFRMTGHKAEYQGYNELDFWEGSYVHWLEQKILSLREQLNTFMDDGK